MGCNWRNCTHSKLVSVAGVSEDPATAEASRPFGDFNFKQLVEVLLSSLCRLQNRRTCRFRMMCGFLRLARKSARACSITCAAAPRVSAYDDVASRHGANLSNLGNIAVRGPDWTADDHGDADGGAGDVVAITAYMGE